MTDSSDSKTQGVAAASAAASDGFPEVKMPVDATDSNVAATTKVPPPTTSGERHQKPAASSRDAPPEIMNAIQTYTHWFKSNKAKWEPLMLEAIGKSTDKLRAFHLFFDTPRDCLSGTIRPQHLERKDIQAMYSDFAPLVYQTTKPYYVLFITVNDGVCKGQALTAQSIV